MKRLRTILFWLHLSVGTSAGIVILIMSATGALLAYESQITNWIDLGQHPVLSGSRASRLSVEELLAKARDERLGLPSYAPRRLLPAGSPEFWSGSHAVS